ncbi:glycosyltransferase family 2 protein [Methylobacterium tarhaniae]|uniref:glycosyltransferase family 2 protein n=1 Tax=Methylobacterium tarhaniae TaxID=1187852 RepID=UPI00069F45BC|nr:glycosyltransferase family 2 protein [Methylobacterium tarhaniae]
MTTATLPTVFGDRHAGFAGLIDHADEQDGIRGWILRIHQPNRPVQWCLMAGDDAILSGLADAVRQDISAALGREARCTLHIAWTQLTARAFGTIARLPPSAKLRLILVETGEEVQWAVPRPTVGWLSRAVERCGRPEEGAEARAIPSAPPGLPSSRDFESRGLAADGRSAIPAPPAGRITDDAGAGSASDLRAVTPAGRVATTVPASYVVEGREGRPEVGIAFEHLFVVDGTLCAAGWMIGAETVEFRIGEDLAPPSLIVVLDRPDVASGYGIPAERARGFVAVWLAPRPPAILFATAGSDLQASLGLRPFSDGAERQATDLLRAHPAFAAAVLRGARAHPAWLRLAAGVLQETPEEFKEARGFIEQAKAVPNIGGMLIGWSFHVPPCEVVVLTDDGVMRSLDEASRWTRDDITAGFGAEFGAFTYDAGYLVALHAPVRATGRVCLVAIVETGAYVIARAAWETAPADAVSFARWAFELPTPAYTFSDRLAAHDAPLIERLIKRRNEGLRYARSDVLAFGQPNPDPHCSLIIPVYGRYDFARHQLLSFAEDAFIRSKCEIVYVLDDPRLADAFVGEADAFVRLYDVPFRIVVGSVNRGFSGATNLGARLGAAPRLLLLNSDVIPLAAGWLERMCETLDGSETVGAVGARLLYPNGSLQHEGMDFEWEPQLDAYVNKHPGMGYPPDPVDCRPRRCEAVTGACLLIRRAEFEAVGMLDEEFLIGDFEDSDLCLKLRERGRDIVLFRDLVLVHLERQSLSLTGETLFRDRVVRYNAWRHQRRWGGLIARNQESERGSHA